jgi:O-antigen ligase
MISYTKLQLNKPTDLIILVILASYPLALIFGNLLINLFIFLFSISFFINFKENKKIFNDKIFYLLFFFLFSLLINVFFSSNPENSFPRAIKILFIIFFVFEIKRLVEGYGTTFIKYIYGSWFVIFLFLTLDILFEIFFGYNIVGNKSYMPGRIASFFGDELIAGAFYHGFVLFFLSYLIFKKSKLYTLIISITFVIIISFLIGERSNFLKLLISTLIFASFTIKANYKIKISIFLIIITTIISTLNFNQYYKYRYFDQIRGIFSKDGYSSYLKKSHYGAHQDAAFKILKNNLLFGIGIKNFRHEAGKREYYNKEFLQTFKRRTTHPHQVHFEFLSETGIFGYLSFLIFLFLSLYLGIKNYFKTKNIYLLSSIIFILTSILPFLPSGSFLSTFSSGIFWLNFAIMSSYIKKN